MRRRKTENRASLDSLLDTMTNVVGILVILLVVTQLGVKDAVSRIARSIDPEAMREVQEEAAAAATRRAELQQQLDDLENTDPEVARRQLETEFELRRRELEQLQADRRQQQQQVMQQVDAARQLEQKQARERAEIEKKHRDLEDQIATLRARLAKPRPKSILPPKIVRLPNPRKAPKGAKPRTFLCREGRIMPLNLEGAQDRSEKWTTHFVKTRRLDRDPQKGVDCAILIRAFNRERIDDDYFTLQLEDRNQLPYLVFQRKKNAGETIDAIRLSRSRYQRILGQIDPTKYYLRFLVFDDSFELYLAARRIATEKGLAAGWQPLGGQSEYRTRLRGTLRCGPPPPPAPKPKPAPPKPAEPPREPPIDTID